MKTKTGIGDGYKTNFATLQRACKSGHLALVDAQDKKTGKQIIVIAAMDYDGKEYTIIPLAKMFDGNPYDELNPPNPSGGYSEIV